METKNELVIPPTDSAQPGQPSECVKSVKCECGICWDCLDMSDPTLNKDSANRFSNGKLKLQKMIKQFEYDDILRATAIHAWKQSRLYVNAPAHLQEQKLVYAECFMRFISDICAASRTVRAQKIATEKGDFSSLKEYLKAKREAQAASGSTKKAKKQTLGEEKPRDIIASYKTDDPVVKNIQKALLSFKSAPQALIGTLKAMHPTLDIEAIARKMGMKI